MFTVHTSGIFPEAHTDAVIQIANMVKIEGDNEPFIRNCFVIGETAPVIGSEIIVSKNEEELLEVIYFLFCNFKFSSKSFHRFFFATSCPYQ